MSSRELVVSKSVPLQANGRNIIIKKKKNSRTMAPHLPRATLLCTTALVATIALSVSSLSPSISIDLSASSVVFPQLVAPVGVRRVSTGGLRMMVPRRARLPAAVPALKFERLSRVGVNAASAGDSSNLGEGEVGESCSIRRRCISAMYVLVHILSVYCMCAQKNNR